MSRTSPANTVHSYIGTWRAQLEALIRDLTPDVAPSLPFLPARRDRLLWEQEPYPSDREGTRRYQALTGALADTRGATFVRQGGSYFHVTTELMIAVRYQVRDQPDLTAALLNDMLASDELQLTAGLHPGCTQWPGVQPAGWEATGGRRLMVLDDGVYVLRLPILATLDFVKTPA